MKEINSHAVVNIVIHNIDYFVPTQPKNSLKECVFCWFGRHSNTVPCCQKYTPTDCLFGDFCPRKARSNFSEHIVYGVPELPSRFHAEEKKNNGFVAKVTISQRVCW